MGLKGKIVLNRKHPDTIASKHLLLQVDDNTAATMTTKENPADGSDTTPIYQADVSGMEMSDTAYVTNKVVKNDSGVVVGKLKKGRLSKFKTFLNK